MLDRPHALLWLMCSGGLSLSVFSVVTNALLLVPALYMLQVYDRVLASGSIETLIYITLIALGCLVALGAIDVLRGFIAGRIGARLVADFGNGAFAASLRGSTERADGIEPIRDLSTVSTFLGGRGLLTLLDLPFAPLFLALLYLLHPALFWMTFGGAALLVGVAILNERIAAGLVADQHEAQSAAAQRASQFVRARETVRALGMGPDAAETWGRAEAASLRARERLDRVNGLCAGVSRSLRLVLQIGVIGLGGYLALDGRISGGMIFAASLLSGRALMPVDALIGSWKQVLRARSAWERLAATLEAGSDGGSKLALPDAEGSLEVRNLVAGAPGAQTGTRPAILRRLSFSVAAGERVAVIGPSGAGKSTLARALVGIVPPWAGEIRLAGNELRNFDQARLGRQVGYLAQDVDLLPGTIAENIARFRADADDDAIVDAARRANAHDLVLRLPDGYDTHIGRDMQILSGGQRQRIGLARAFFGQPRFIVLDEPNAHLDSEGEAALEAALAAARAAGVTTIVVTQRRALAERADRILILREGAIEAFGGPEILRELGFVPAATSEAQARGALASATALEDGSMSGERPAVLLEREDAETRLRKGVAHAH